jgi:translation initiation factor 5A
MSDEENTFEKGDAGSADCTPCSYGDIKKGGYCMLKGFPCKVTEYSTAKPGKHGSAKATIVGIEIFSNKKYEDTAPTGATASVPNVTKEELEVADIDEDDFVTCILPDGDLKTDLKLPVEDEECYAELKKSWDERGDKTIYFTIQRAVGKEKFISTRAK